MKIYTKFGDEGNTSLFGGKVVRKNHMRVDIYGTLDELNSLIGILILKIPDSENEVKQLLYDIQNQIFVFSSEIATPDEKTLSKFEQFINEVHIQLLEDNIDKYSEKLPKLKNFILPGGSDSAAAAHLVRTVSRRAERRLINWHEVEPVRKELLIYLNRLSDFFFIIARYMNVVQQKDDILWKGRS
ncbi:MAG: cob(I)yrinic acid a,c-diamide adenosyltransferase [Caldithrix sp.]|nr:cob(I)yrinic acid a,c-diamide adenosyltransferase [Caldithrix sp.]